VPKASRLEPRQRNRGTGICLNGDSCLSVRAGRTIGAEPIFIDGPGAEVTPGAMGIDPDLVETSDRPFANAQSAATFLGDVGVSNG